MSHIHKRPNNDTWNALAQIPIKELSDSLAPQYYLVTFGYIRNKHNNMPISIINYIAIFAFYAPSYEYKSDFDTNGIVYAIATHYGQTKWTNPGKQGLIRIKSSRWLDGNIEDVLSRTKAASWCSSSSFTNAWLSIDFRAKKKIKPSHYTLRNDCGGFYLRKWNFEGSNNGTDWTVLREHDNDTSLNSAYDTHTWAINVDQYYQMFRIFMTGEDSSNMYWYLSCSGFEIYGHLSDLTHGTKHQTNLNPLD
eukprot:356792_1